MLLPQQLSEQWGPDHLCAALRHLVGLWFGVNNHRLCALILSLENSVVVVENCRELSYAWDLIRHMAGLNTVVKTFKGNIMEMLQNESQESRNE